MRELRNQEAWLVIIFLSSFLLVRYSGLLPLLLNIFDVQSTHVTGVSGPTGIKIIIVGVFAWLSHSLKLVLCKGSKHKNDTGFFELVMLFAFAFCVLFLAKFFYTPYSDEIRDISLLNLISSYGYEIYVNKSLEVLVQISKDELFNLNWGRSLHPIGHYFPALMTKSLPALVSWRLIYSGFVLVATLVCLLWVRLKFKDKRVWQFFMMMGALTLSLTFFRNYTLIRVGNELFPMVFSSIFFIKVNQLLNDRTQLSSVKDFFGWYLFLSMILFLAVSAKYSVLVTLLSTIAAAFLVFLVFRKTEYLRLFAVISLSSLTAVTAHVSLWWETDMMNEQIAVYGAKILSAMGVALPAEFATSLSLGNPENTIPMFFVRSVFWLGPPVFIGLVFSVASFFRKRAWNDPKQLAVVCLLFVNVVGVLLVNARAQYLACISIPMVYFIATHLKDRLTSKDFQWVALVVFMFAMTEVVLSSVS